MSARPTAAVIRSFLLNFLHQKRIDSLEIAINWRIYEASNSEMPTSLKCLNW